MADFKQMFRRNRFALEILGIVAFAEVIVMLLLDRLALPISALLADLLDAVCLLLVSAPLIIWRCRLVHGRETQRLAQAVQSSGNAIVLLDTQGRIVWVNEGFTRITGYALEEAMGAMPDVLLGSGKSDAAVLERLRICRDRAEPCRVEVCNRKKNGELYWGDLEFRPDFDRRGSLVGFIEICSDVTELKQAKHKLKASLLEAETFRRALDAHAIVSVADRAGVITDTNPTFCAISGYSREQLIGSKHRLLNSGTHGPEFWTAMWGDISKGKPWRGEICNRNSQGQLYWVDSIIAPFVDVDGRVEKYVSIRMDITARKLLEAERQRQSQLLADVLHSLPYGTVVFDENQEMRLHNAQYARMLRLPPELLEQSPFRFADQLRYAYARGDYDQSQSLDTLLEQSQQLWAARRMVRMELVQSDGSHLDVHAYPLAGNWTVLTYVDITERKTQELLLGEAQERVRLATESAGIGIWSLHPITGVQEWDAQQYRLFGLPYDPQASVPIDDLWSSHLHPDDAEQAETAFRQSLANGVPFVNQFRIIRPDGAVRHIKALGSPRLDAQGRVEYIVGTNQDVTDSTLLTETMAEARDRAEEANRVKSQFMANMSHEVRSPMNAVMGLLKLLEYTAVDARQQGYITQAGRASRLMLRMIDSVLDYSRLEADRVELNCDAFGVDAWLEELALVLAGTVGDKDINVLFDVPSPLPAVLLGDRKRLQQALFCLMDNAIKFTPQGEVVCQITLVQQSAASCRLAFCIGDTGIGIAPEFLHTIFTGYVQLQSGSTRAYGGVGLGLSVAQRLVQLMGGNIEVQSKPGQGSQFFFTLDLALPESQPLELPAEVPVRQPDAAALVVDACPVARRLIAAQAAALHGPAETAGSCLQALDRVRSRLAGAGSPFTLVLLDWNMPDADSWQTLQQLRALYSEYRQAQPQVLMVSNNGNEAQETRLLDREGLADGSLAKPFTENMLRKALRRAPARPMDPAAKPERPLRLQGMRVLVVEDNPINQRVMEEMLLTEGASVCLAGNGQLGVDAIRAALPQQGFDVVLMDIQMPVMDGYQASRAIREGLALTTLPIIAVSANVQAADRAQSLAAGMNVHIGKPYVLDELVAEMRRLTGRGGQAQAPAQPMLDALQLQLAEVPALHAYWIQGREQEAMPDPAALLLQGVVLHRLDSVEALALQMEGAAAQAALLVVDLATATGKPLCALRAAKGAGLQSMALVVLTDAATEDDMADCVAAGAVDMVPWPYARDNLGAIARKHINAQGGLRVDQNNQVVAIDGHGAMARIQSDLPFFGSLLRAFFDELPLRLQLLRQEWGSEPEQVKHRSHALKGLAVTLGLESLADVARRAEAINDSQTVPDAALLLQMEGEMQSARFHILRWLTCYLPNNTASP